MVTRPRVQMVKADIMNLFHDFPSRRTFVKGFNVTFISLIPKKPRAVNRLKMVVEKTISMPHNAVIKGRQILDSILIANECVDSRLRYEVLGVLCELDLEKAFDQVNQDFLLYMLRDMILQKYGVNGWLTIFPLCPFQSWRMRPCHVSLVAPMA